MGKTFNMVGGGGGVKLASIAITTPPVKTAYRIGETFSAAGMIVTATYSNGATMQATGYNFEPSVPLTLSDTSVTIRYTEGGVTKTATQSITVERLPGSITLSKTSVTLDSDQLSDTITVTRAGSGAITAESSDTSVATVSVSGNVVTVNSVNGTSGSATITITAEESSMYKQASATAGVVAQFAVYLSGTAKSVATSGSVATFADYIADASTANSIAKLICKNSSINENTQDVYVTMSDDSVYRISANGAQTTKVTIPMIGKNYDFDIIGFNHDEDDVGKVGITFQMHDVFITNTYPMKTSMTSTDGWHNSDLRNNTMPPLMGYMPADWQSILVAVNKQTCLNVSDATLNTTKDKLFVPSEWEVFGSNTYAKAQEGTQYAYYKNDGTKVKKLSGSAGRWWERSPRSWNITYSSFCAVMDAGNSAIRTANFPHGAAPCFCIGSAAYVATTTIPSGSQIQAGIAGLSAAEIKKIANAISANSSIDNTISVCYVDTGAGYYTISIGDQISWTMNGTSYAYRIMGFNHYDKADGSGKAGILFQMVDCFNTKYLMKSSVTTSDGWDDSDLRTTLNSTLYGYLPSDVQSAISQVTIKTAQDVSTSTIITTDDKLFVPAEVEIFRSTEFAKGGTNEGVWYPWYKANNSAANRAKKVNGSASDWWERSPRSWANSSSYFCTVMDTGASANNSASYSRGTAPCFCF